MASGVSVGVWFLCPVGACSVRPIQKRIEGV
jgi:hypothetical protein